MKLTALAFLVGPTVISAENERSLGQQDAADRVSLAVKSAMDVHGVAMPLNYVKLSEQFGGEQQLTVALRLPGVDEDQNLLIDTGSSALAFCNSSLATEATDITKTDYAKCDAYGTGVCPDGSSGGSLGWVGPVYQGDVTAYDISTEEEVAAMEDVYFTIMEEQFNFYSCDGPLDGTIGVAYTSMNTATALPSTNFNASDLMNFLCIEEGVLQCSGEYGSTPLPAALEQSLSGDVESGYNAQEAFGLYLDYAATVDAEPDTILPGVGAYFGGNQAFDNEFYNLGTPHTAKSPSNNPNYIGIIIRSLRLPDQNVSLAYNSSYCSSPDCAANGCCITDTGTSWIQLPIEQELCDKLANMEGDDSGDLLIDLEDPDGGLFTLSLPFDWIIEQAGQGRVRCLTEEDVETDHLFVLGLPITQFYYTVYDMANNTVTFVDLRQSNATEDSMVGDVVSPIDDKSNEGYLLAGLRSILSSFFVAVILVN